VNLPDKLTLNAFTGTGVEVSGGLTEVSNRWGSKGDMLARQAPMAPGPAISKADWANPDIGWGVVMADRDDVSPADKAVAADAPEPIRKLLAHRGGSPVLRYRPELRDYKLIRYFPDGTCQSPEIGISDFGTGKGQLPLYLLIVGSPEEVPWRLQFAINRRHHCGRLDLPPEGLEHYVNALISDWQGIDSHGDRAVVWSVRMDSITHKMEVTLANLIDQAMRADNELAVSRISAAHATHESLFTALTEQHPAVIVTSSHGRTGPLNDPDAMRRSLGLPVDVNGLSLDLDALIAAWQPSGAVWYAQACCSAGGDTGTSYSGLLAEDSLAYQVVHAVGQLGAAVAPLPTRLLSAEKPLRAFIGHVEPTFDWTLMNTDTGQFLTGPLVEFCYPNLYRREPVGLALSEHYEGVGQLYGNLAAAREGVNGRVPGARDDATYYKLTAIDRQSLVILGDPTAVIPPLPSQRR
jgi:hypothetical protein